MTKREEYIRKVDWISTSELLSELSDRFKDMAFIGIKPEEGGVDGRVMWKASGNYFTLKGLVNELDEIIREDDIDVEEVDGA